MGATYRLGDTHRVVREAQRILNSSACPVAASGPGAPGFETFYFGSLTEQALRCYQRLHNLPDDGILSPEAQQRLRLE